MRRSIAAFSLRPETLSLINELTLKARADTEVATFLGLERTAPIVKPSDTLIKDLDPEGLSPTNYVTLTQLLGGGPVLTATTFADKVSEKIQQRGQGALALKALQYAKSARRANNRAVRIFDKVLSSGRSAINNSRVVEALILVGAECLENGRSGERSSKFGISQGSYAKKAARKSFNTSTCKIDETAASN